MNEMLKCHEAHMGELIRSVDAASDVKAATDIAAAYLGRLADEAAAQMPDACARRRVRALTSVAQASIQSIGAVSEADWRAMPEQPIRRARSRFKRALPLIPASIMGVLAVFLFLTGQTNQSIAALLAGGMAYVFVRDGARSVGLPAIVATPRVNGAELSRRIGFLTREIDARMQDEGERLAPARGTVPLFEAAQMLMEAKLTDDGAFALKGVTQLVDALNGQGVELIAYSEDARGDFDLLPAIEGGRTIRPAVLQDGKLLLRGQATEKMR